ncbi:MAG: bacillithiol biosynthesis cysteine-adding enzyme BshC [Alicyclobacillaceae bacterium]|nr:bacillithiol biosynthesis cysteine-adding enzyme BshC [Alicyclobacillaceae bacterium]
MEWTVRFEPTGNRLADLHAADFAAVADLYDGQDPRRLDTYRKRAEWTDQQVGVRERLALAESLECYLRDIGASEQALANARRLREPQAVAVVTGQQAGLFTGPLYTLYKAMTAVGVALRLQRELQRPVVPVFWIASEDHDWAEVDHAYLLDRNDEIRRIRLRQDVPAHQMVWHTRVSPDAAQHAIRDAFEALPDGPGKFEMAEVLQATYRPHASLADWFARLMARLTAPWGLVLLDPCLPGLRQLARPVWTAALERLSEVERCLDDAYRRLQDRGFVPVVVRDRAHTNVFVVDNGRRYVLERTDGGRLRARGLGVERDASEWLRLAHDHPEQFSANVLLRPVVQDHLLPTLVYVGGAAEIAYHPLAAGVFHAFGRMLPPLLLRQRVTLYPPHVVRHMRRWNLSLESVAQPVDLVSPVLRQLGGAQVEAELEQLAEDSRRRWNAFASRFAEVGPQVREMADAQIRRELGAIERIRGKTLRLMADRHRAQVAQLRQVERWLWTDGHAQERRLCLLSPWARQGIGWLPELPCWDGYEQPGVVYHVRM